MPDKTEIYAETISRKLVFDKRTKTSFTVTDDDVAGSNYLCDEFFIRRFGRKPNDFSTITLWTNYPLNGVECITTEVIHADDGTVLCGDSETGPFWSVFDAFARDLRMLVKADGLIHTIYITVQA